MKDIDDHPEAQVGIVLWDEKGYTEGSRISKTTLKKIIDRLQSFPPQRTVEYDILIEDMVAEGILEVEGRRHDNWNGRTSYIVASDEWRMEYETEELTRIQEGELDDPTKLTEYLE